MTGELGGEVVSWSVRILWEDGGRGGWGGGGGGGGGGEKADMIVEDGGLC